MNYILDDIRIETNEQYHKWGVQNHHPEKWMNILMEEVGEASEAVLEAFPFKEESETKKEWLERYRKELIQIAAVAVSAINSLDRNELG